MMSGARWAIGQANHQGERGGRPNDWFRVPKRTEATLPLETGLTSGSESLLESSELEAGLTGFGMVNGGGSDKCWE